MAPIDWSWGERYNTPTLVIAPMPVPISSYAAPPTVASQEQQHLTTMSTDQPSAEQWTCSAKPEDQSPSQSARRPLFVTTKSHKRSRDEMCDLDDSPASSSSHSSPTNHTPSPLKHNQEPIYGPGMTLIYPGEPGYTADAGSQTGTWAEELSERLKASTVGERDRPSVESRKSIRLDKEAPDLDDVARAMLPEDVRSGAAVLEYPVIDEATRALGISWTSIPCTLTMEAASRGWARYIESRFPLQAVRVVWQNKTIPAYLVSAVTCEAGRGQQGSPGYYLFDEALDQGRLVAKSWETTLDCLRANPMVFQGETTMIGGVTVGQQEGNMVMDTGASSGFSGAGVEKLAHGSNGGEGMDVDV